MKPPLLIGVRPVTQPVHVPQPKRPHTAFWRVLAVAALVFYLVAALYQLHLPGLNYDEALDAVPAMQKVLGQPVDSYGVVDLGGQQWPLMTMSFVGVTSTYALLPVFSWFGASLTALRVTAVLIGLVALVVVWGFLKDFFDERAAALTVLLLAASASFVFWARMGAWVALPLLPITTAALWLLFGWYQRRQPGYLIAACFGLGLGLGTHIKFLWVWAALVLAWLLLSPWLGTIPGWRRWLWPWQISSKRTWALGAAALLLGSSPIILYNLLNHGTFSYALGMVGRGEMGQTPTPAYLWDLMQRAGGVLDTLLSGTWFRSKLGGPFRNPLALPVFWLAVGTVVGLAAWQRLAYRPKRVAFFIILLLTVALLSVVVRVEQSAYHLLMVSPVPWALVALGLIGVADAATGARRPARRVLLCLLTILAVGLAGAGAWTIFRYHSALAATGGEGLFSDAIYTLASDLERPGAPRAIALDWGFRRNLQLLTHNRVDPPEWYTFSSPPGPEYEGYVTDLLNRYPGVLYLFHTPRWTVFPGHKETFERTAYRHRMTPVLWKTYRQRDGQPVYLAYTVAPSPRLFEAPAVAHRLDAQVGQGLALLGYDLAGERVKPGQEIDLTLYWQAGQVQTADHKVFVHLLDSNGKLWAQHDSPPVYGSYPVTRWQAGEIVPDHIWLPAPGDLPPGVYHLFVGMYDEGTGQRLPLTLAGQRLVGDTLGLAEITVD